MNLSPKDFINKWDKDKTMVLTFIVCVITILVLFSLLAAWVGVFAEHLEHSESFFAWMVRYIAKGMEFLNNWWGLIAAAYYTCKFRASYDRNKQKRETKPE